MAGENQDIEQLLLTALSKEDTIENSWDYALSIGIDHQALIGAVKSLLVDRYVADEQLSITYTELTEEGRNVVKNGSPEIVVYNTIANAQDGSIAVTELNKLVGDMAKIGLGACMKNKWVKKVGDQLVKVS